MNSVAAPADDVPVGAKLAIGTAQFGMDYGVSNSAGRVSAEEVSGILSVARSLGSDTLDTARAYGSSEETLGRLGVHDWRIVTKVPKYPGGASSAGSWVKQSVAASLSALNRNDIDAVLLHDARDLFAGDGREVYEALRELQTEGKCRAIGVSIYAPQFLEQILARFTLDIVQAPLNVFDQRLISSGALSRLVDHGIEVHVRSVFLQGLLLMVHKARPAYFRPWMELLRLWDSSVGYSLDGALRACLAFVKGASGIDRIVVGVESAAHLRILSDALSSGSSLDFRAFQSDDEALIEPSRWDLK